MFGFAAGGKRTASWAGVPEMLTLFSSGTWTSWTSGVWRWVGGRCSLLLGVAGESKGLTWMLCVLFHPCRAPVSAGTARGLKVCVSPELNQEQTQIRRGSTLVKLLRSILQSWTVAPSQAVKFLSSLLIQNSFAHNISLRQRFCVIWYYG